MCRFGDGWIPYFAKRMQETVAITTSFTDALSVEMLMQCSKVQ
jgi:hypothetical protein